MLEISITSLRKVSMRGSKRATGLFVSTKMPMPLPWESYLEKYTLGYFELDPEVKWIFVQALPLRFEIDGVWHSHFPDICVFRKDRWKVHEVKPDHEADSEEVRKVAIAASREIRMGIVHLSAAETNQPVIYNIVPERVLVAEPLFSNARDLLRCRHIRVSDPIAQTVSQALLRSGPLPVAELAEQIRPLGGTLQQVLALVARGRARLNLKDQRLDPTSLAWAPEHCPFDTRLIPIQSLKE